MPINVPKMHDNLFSKDSLLLMADVKLVGGRDKEKRNSSKAGEVNLIGSTNYDKCCYKLRRRSRRPLYYNDCRPHTNDERRVNNRKNWWPLMVSHQVGRAESLIVSNGSLPLVAIHNEHQQTISFKQLPFELLPVVSSSPKRPSPGCVWKSL